MCLSSTASQQAACFWGIGWLLARVMGAKGVPGSRALHSPSGKSGFVLLMPERGSKKVAEAHKAS